MNNSLLGTVGNFQHYIEHQIGSQWRHRTTKRTPSPKPFLETYINWNIVALCFFVEISTKNHHETIKTRLVIMWPVAGLSQRFGRLLNWFGKAVTRSSKLSDIPGRLQRARREVLPTSYLSRQRFSICSPLVILHGRLFRPLPTFESIWSRGV